MSSCSGGLPDLVGNQPQPILLTACGARSWMDDDAHQPECIRPIELVDERGNRLLPQRTERRRKVDQIAGV